MVLPWYGRTLIGPTDNDYDGDIDAVPPSAGDVEYLLDAVNAYLDLSLTPADVVGAYAGVRPADLERGPEEVRRHLAEGGALRDLLGDAHHHRRKADDVAPNGRGHRQPDRRARGSRG